MPREQRTRIGAAHRITEERGSSGFRSRPGCHPGIISLRTLSRLLNKKLSSPEQHLLEPTIPDYCPYCTTHLSFFQEAFPCSSPRFKSASRCVTTTCQFSRSSRKHPRLLITVLPRRPSPQKTSWSKRWASRGVCRN